MGMEDKNNLVDGPMAMGDNNCYTPPNYRRWVGECGDGGGATKAGPWVTLAAAPTS